MTRTTRVQFCMGSSMPLKGNIWQSTRTIITKSTRTVFTDSLHLTRHYSTTEMASLSTGMRSNMRRMRPPTMRLQHMCTLKKRSTPRNYTCIKIECTTKKITTRSKLCMMILITKPPL